MQSAELWKISSLRSEIILLEYFSSAARKVTLTLNSALLTHNFLFYSQFSTFDRAEIAQDEAHRKKASKATLTVVEKFSEEQRSIAQFMPIKKKLAAK